MRILSILLMTTAASATACAAQSPELLQPVGQTMVTSASSRPLRESTTPGVGNDTGSCELDRLPVIEFEPGSRDLGESQTSALRQLAGCLKAAPHETSGLVLVGHTDVLGTNAENLVIGLEHAQTVMRQLMADGVSPGRIVVASAGELQRPHERWGLRAHRVEILMVQGGPSRPDEPPIARGIDARGLFPRPPRVNVEAAPPGPRFVPPPGPRSGSQPGRGHVRPAAPPVAR